MLSIGPEDYGSVSQSKSLFETSNNVNTIQTSIYVDIETVLKKFLTAMSG